MAQSPCPFVWYELMTSDSAAAESFYRQVVGWTTRDAGMPGMRYTLLSAGGGDVAGLMDLPAEACAAGARPGWLGYVGVDDVDAATARLRQAGGHVHKEPADIPGVGRFAVVADPQGATLALFKGAADMAPTQPAADTPGRVGWHELHAGEEATAFAFYSTLFGWTQADTMDMGPMGIYRLFAAGSTAIGGMMTRTPEMPVPCWLFYFNVEAIDAAAERVRAQGGRVVNGPMEVPGGSWIVNALDPQGALFALVAPKR